MCILNALMLGLLWFLCYHLNLEIWKIIHYKTSIYTFILGLILIVVMINNLNESDGSGEGEFIAILIPKKWFDK